MVTDVALPTVVAGILGARIYHVATDPELYFTPGRHPLDALKIWDGGLGIPGALLFGALGAWWGCRRAGVALSDFGDAVVPGIAAAQAIGRWGNWFNNELYGRPTSLPWRLRIHDWADGRAVRGPDGQPVVAGYFHPTFLYESLWDAGLAVALLVLDRRRVLRRGHLVAGYVAGYAVGRLWVESLRVDYANTLLGLRVNTWASLAALTLAVTFLLVRHRRGPTATTTGPADTSDVRSGAVRR